MTGLGRAAGGTVVFPGSPGSCLGADVVGEEAAGGREVETQSSLELKGSALLER